MERDGAIAIRCQDPVRVSALPETSIPPLHARMYGAERPSLPLASQVPSSRSITFVAVAERAIAYWLANSSHSRMFAALQ